MIGVYRELRMGQFKWHTNRHQSLVTLMQGSVLCHQSLGFIPWRYYLDHEKNCPGYKKTLRKITMGGRG